MKADTKLAPARKHEEALAARKSVLSETNGCKNNAIVVLIMGS